MPGSRLLQRILLTGGPGAGKTTVLGQLCSRGFSTGADAARSIIQERLAQSLSPRPEPAAFAQLVFDREVAAYDAATASPTFFERGVPDALGGLYASGSIHFEVVEKLLTAYPYDTTAFLFPPWREIYITDSERDHSFDHAQMVYQKTRDWYGKCGYQVVEVPMRPATERADFILKHVNGF